LRSFIVFLLILFLSFSAIVFFAWRDFTSPSSLSQETTVVLPRGNGFAKTVDILAENNVITHPQIIKLFAYLNGDSSKVKAGEYIFPAGISPQAVLQMLVAGKVVTHKITIVEGLNVLEITELLNAEKMLEGNIPENIEEGSLFPETYHFTYGDSRASIIARMQEKMQKTLADLWEKRADNLPIVDKQQALVLASIVEKETGLASERARVAAVFVNRLKKGMRLQSDPTTAYGIEKVTGKPLGRALVTSDLKTPTLYNTYVIDGLPPAPISNPSREAIEATLHPMETDELYFVATGKGGHNFASNLEQHNKNVQEYRAKIGR
jgi:UPF0755 protein